MAVKKYKFPLFIAILTLILCMGVFSLPVYASGGESETLIVNAAWLDGETVRIDVTDPQTEANSTLAVPLKDYLKDGDNSEFISIQATDLNGKQSGVVEIKNPFYNPNLPQVEGNTEEKNEDDKGESESAINNPNANANLRPFTPNGTGTVVDNVGSNMGKEFFTINSVEGDEFFLVVDRQRGKENVYFLNAVTEEDLMALAQKNGKEITGINNGSNAIPTPDTDTNPRPIPEITDGENKPEQTENEPPTSLNRIGNNLTIMGVIAVVVGGLAYYLKVVRPKKNAYNDDEDEDEYGLDDALDDETDDFDDDGGDE